MRGCGIARSSLSGMVNSEIRWSALWRVAESKRGAVDVHAAQNNGGVGRNKLLMLVYHQGLDRNYA